MSEKKRYEYPSRECPICKCSVAYYNMSHHRKSKKHKRNVLKRHIEEIREIDPTRYIDLLAKWESKIINEMSDIVESTDEEK